MNTPSASARRFRLLLPLMLAGMLVALGALAVRHIGPRPESEREVRRQVRDIILTGGWMGPFRVTADRYDHASGEFIGFVASTDRLIIGARRARIEIDPAIDEITLSLFVVEMLRIPGREDAEAVGDESSIVSREFLTLGPFPYKHDIIGDPRRGTPGPVTQHEETVVEAPAEH